MTLEKPLTQKQEAFCVQYVRLGDGGKAYRAAYDSKGKDSTVWVEASRLLDDPRIEARIKEIRAKIAERAEIQVADVIRELWKNSKAAQETGQTAASNQALIALGNHLGAFTKRAEAKTPLDELSHAELKDLVGKLKTAKQGKPVERAEPESGDGGPNVVPFPRSATE